MNAAAGRVLLTDHPWRGTDIEEVLCRRAGYQLVVAPPGAGVAELADLASQADGILTCWAPVSAAVISASKRLRVIVRLGVGLDNIDVQAALERGVIVTRVPDYCVEEVSDHAVALVYAWARGVVALDRQVRGGMWDSGGLILRRISDLAIGIWGLGTMGMRTAQKFSALGCKVLVDNRHPERTPAGSQSVPIGELLAGSDVVSLHLPLTPETAGVMDAQRLAAMRPGSLLVNTGRGALVDVPALCAALDRGRPQAAALDVVPGEPAVPVELVSRSDVILTPHVAFSSNRSVTELRRRAMEDLLGVLHGQPPRHGVSGTAAG
jgi:D-3-phosphoglycerate dehydrogenase